MNRIARLCVMLTLAVGCAREARPESLWKKASPKFKHLYTDDKARRIGDVVTIIIDESIRQRNDEEAKLDRDTTADTTIDQLRAFHRTKANVDVFKTLPDLGYSSQRRFQGTGEYTAQSEYQTRITAVVKEVLDNGMLLVEGRREIKIGDDVKKVILTGLIRPNDISPDNTVMSQYIADMKLHNEASGPVSRTRRRGWLDKILAFVWPF